jgi:pyruvate formate lyase activating enzyme
MIFNIQRFSLHDGDGIRTLIFYKGCPLRCQWCSNPESHTFGYSIVYDHRRCQQFGDCIQAVPRAFSRENGEALEIRRREIQNPLELKDVCASRALVLYGEDRPVDELMAEVEKDLPFYGKDGGVTLSGGEPLSQDGDLILLLHQLREKKISTFMETSLHVSWARIERCIGLVGTFLVDLKHTEPEKFRRFTGGDARLVMRNLEQLVYFGARVVVRIPVIPGFNHSLPEIRQMVDRIRLIRGIGEIHFLPYHTFGMEKYRMLGLEYEFGPAESIKETELEPYVEYAQSRGFRTKIGG